MSIRTILLLVLLTTLAAPAALAGGDKAPRKKKAPKAPTITWSPMDHSRFDVMSEEGILASCAYRALKEGQAFEAVHRDKIKVKVSKAPGDRLETELFLSDREASEELGEALVKDAFQTAIDACYEKLSD